MVTALHSNSYMRSRGTRSPLCMLSPDSNLNSCHTLSICPDSRGSALISPTCVQSGNIIRLLLFIPVSSRFPALPPPSRPPVGCLSRHSLGRRRMKAFRDRSTCEEVSCAAREVCSLTRVRMVFIIKAHLTVLKRRRSRLLLSERRNLNNKKHPCTQQLYAKMKFKGAVFSFYLHCNRTYF